MSKVASALLVAAVLASAPSLALGAEWTVIIQDGVGSKIASRKYEGLEVGKLINTEVKSNNVEARCRFTTTKSERHPKGTGVYDVFWVECVVKGIRVSTNGTSCPSGYDSGTLKFEEEKTDAFFDVSIYCSAK